MSYMKMINKHMMIVRPSLSKMTMNSTVCVSVVGVVGAKVTD